MCSSSLFLWSAAPAHPRPRRGPTGAPTLNLNKTYTPGVSPGPISLMKPTLYFSVRAHRYLGALAAGLLLAAGLPLAPALAPVLIGLSPARNLPNAPRVASVAVGFDQAMSPGAATAGALTVFSQQRGGRMSGSQGGAATVSGNTLTFDPTTDFRPGETLYTTLTTAAQSSGGVSLARP